LIEAIVMDRVHTDGISFFGMLQILFIGLKLTDYIDWSWWWVLSPILCTVGLACIVIGIVIALVIIVGGICLVGFLLGGR